MARRASHRTPVDHRRESRMPRKMLAANHIFAEDASPNASYDTSGYGGDMSNSVADMSTALSPVAKTAPTRDFQIPSIAILQSPARRRRNTLETESPAKAANTSRSLDMDRLCDSPCKRKDRSRSSGDLLQRHIAPKAQLNYEIDHREFNANESRMNVLTNLVH
jgi:serine/threonine-protein kinase GIN4